MTLLPHQTIINDSLTTGKLFDQCSRCATKGQTEVRQKVQAPKSFVGTLGSFQARTSLSSFAISSCRRCMFFFSSTNLSKRMDVRVLLLGPKMYEPIEINHSTFAELGTAVLQCFNQRFSQGLQHSVGRTASNLQSRFDFIGLFLETNIFNVMTWAHRIGKIFWKNSECF